MSWRKLQVGFVRAHILYLSGCRSEMKTSTLQFFKSASLWNLGIKRPPPEHLLITLTTTLQRAEWDSQCKRGIPEVLCRSSSCVPRTKCSLLTCCRWAQDCCLLALSVSKPPLFREALHYFLLFNIDSFMCKISIHKLWKALEEGSLPFLTGLGWCGSAESVWKKRYWGINIKPLAALTTCSSALQNWDAPS